MKYIALALAALTASVSACSDHSCTVPCYSATVTVTVPYGNVPTAPGGAPPTSAPYPVGGGDSPYVPTGTAPLPSGTGSYNASMPEFTGAASKGQIGGILAGAVGIAALLI